MQLHCLVCLRMRRCVSVTRAVGESGRIAVVYVDIVEPVILRVNR